MMKKKAEDSRHWKENWMHMQPAWLIAVSGKVAGVYSD